MEFPELGSACFECKQLDFLPVKCDACGEKFCMQHWRYDLHGCQRGSRMRDVQVPICPLCDRPVASKNGQLPDIAVSAHLDNDCQSSAAKNRIYANRCSMKKCKQKELVQILCPSCSLNFCLKHRHPQDHSCEPGKRPGPSASVARPQHQRVATAELQAGLAEEEALRLAIEASLNDCRSAAATSPPGLSQVEQDRQLAEAIARSEREAATAASSGSQSNGQKNCLVS